MQASCTGPPHTHIIYIDIRTCTIHVHTYTCVCVTEYQSAFLAMRAHRIDLNLIYDFNPAAFIQVPLPRHSTFTDVQFWCTHYISLICTCVGWYSIVYMSACYASPSPARHTRMHIYTHSS